MLALGANRAELLETDGREWGPIATAEAIVAAARRSGPFDLLLFGNEAADTGDYQVGVRVAHALGLPCVTGIKNLDGRRRRRAGAARVPRGGGESTDIPLPAVVWVKEGINLPRYPSLPGRLRAKRATIEQPHPESARRGPAQGTAAGPGGRNQAGRDPRHRRRRGARPGRPARRARSAVMTVLCLVERDGDGAADVSLRALTFARSLAGSGAGGVAAAVFGPGAPAELSTYGVADAYAVEAGNGYAPQAWGLALAGLAAELNATAVVAAGTDRGSEVLAHLAAITGLPMAANCVSAELTAAGTFQLVRHRWAGSLLEDSVLDASPALLTVAVDAVAAVPAGTPARLPNTP